MSLRKEYKEELKVYCPCRKLSRFFCQFRLSVVGDSGEAEKIVDPDRRLHLPPGRPLCPHNAFWGKFAFTSLPSFPWRGGEKHENFLLKRRIFRQYFSRKMAFHDPWAARHDRHKVDLAFIVDCTGSMGPYIRQAQKHIRSIAETVARTAFNVKLALVEYRDHPPQDQSFITKVHDFTSSVNEMKTWVDNMKARGGGDGPESVACALHEAMRLSFRQDATKMCVLIADAPPHGLGLDYDGFPDGCPDGNDPLVACRDMVESGIVLYCVGCEPAILRYKDFFMGLAFATGGQYVPLSRAQALSKVIINGTLEEVSQENLMGYVEDFLFMELAKRQVEEKKITVDDLASELERHLSLRGVKCQQLQCNSTSLDPASPTAKKIAGQESLSEVRSLLKSLQPMDYQSYYNIHMTTAVEVALTEPAPVSKNQCERLLVKELGRKKVPVMHDEETGELTVDPIYEL